ncbi:MAG TPA: ubiquinol-cytochrome c reductase iron-sulfur subunit [Candidatus Dormibacteraeota bacterium]|nr:ubiquinol-cytochrome c reductase iron-sulfur subunit [Candidatus Dormibacteraeota bacterium]
MADTGPPSVTRRTFIGWWMASILTSVVVIAAAPILVFLWPAPAKGQKKGPIKVGLSKPIDQIADGEAVKFDAPTSPNSAFIMADGGGDNAAGDLAFGGFVAKDKGKVNVFAINCSHLGCPIGLNTTDKTFDCPCHGSRFHLDGTVLHGPAAYPLARLTWKQGDTPDTIVVDGIALGF